MPPQKVLEDIAKKSKKTVEEVKKHFKEIYDRFRRACIARQDWDKANMSEDEIDEWMRNHKGKP